jgi:hypothetical protein
MPKGFDISNVIKATVLAEAYGVVVTGLVFTARIISTYPPGPGTARAS